MKVIFLDNDGVICLSNNWGSRYKKWKKFSLKNPDVDFINRPVECRFDNFDRKAIVVLNSILETTGAEIVVSSDWRAHANLEELGNYYQDQGIIKKPIGVTPFFNEIKSPEDFKFKRSVLLEQERHFEILEWLKHNKVTHWVSVDDLNMGPQIADSKEWGLRNFVLTPKSSEGIKQSGIKDKITHFLSS
jgi:hypothetical protein